METRILGASDGAQNPRGSQMRQQRGRWQLLVPGELGQGPRQEMLGTVEGGVEDRWTTGEIYLDH